jgi:hypothetical protein
MTKSTVLFYGTCQSQGIKDVLNLSNDDYIQYHIQCYNTDISKEALDNILNICDIIITQPIPDNYRDVDYLSTTYLINNCKKDCMIVIYQRQYFNFYYYDTIYYTIDNNVLHEPNDYHYQEMINYYKKNSENENLIKGFIKDIVSNNKLKTKKELDYIANESIQFLFDRDRDIKNKYLKNLSKRSGDKELCSKENIIYISIVNFIKNNYKDKLLFYSMNHPTKVLLQYIAEEILKKINLKTNINYDIDPLNEPKCILYSCIQNAVNFDISNEKVALGDRTSVESVIDLYYDTYRKIGIK